MTKNIHDEVATDDIITSHYCVALLCLCFRLCCGFDWICVLVIRVGFVVFVFRLALIGFVCWSVCTNLCPGRDRRPREARRDAQEAPRLLRLRWRCVPVDQATAVFNRFSADHLQRRAPNLPETAPQRTSNGTSCCCALQDRQHRRGGAAGGAAGGRVLLEGAVPMSAAIVARTPLRGPVTP